jgi:hypothetical protein
MTNHDDSELFLAKLTIQEDWNETAHKETSTILESLRGMYSRLRTSQQTLSDREEQDWTFWSQVLASDYADAKAKAAELTKRVKLGIPDKLRGIAWQFLLQSKDEQLEHRYKELLKKTSPFSKQIQLDLARTFPNNAAFKDLAQDELYNVLNALAIHDAELGYCQGLPFVVGPLLLHLPEEETFSLLINLLRSGGMREMYLPSLQGLLLRLHQFEKLVEERLPQLNAHFQDQGIRASMYATQWFMTLFASTAPLHIVYRVLDVVCLEGFETIFRFALALLTANQSQLLAFEFDATLDFLKNQVFAVYEKDLDAWPLEASKIMLDKSMLDKLALDYASQQRQNDFTFLQCDQLKAQLLRQTRELRRLQKDHEDLVEEHIASTRELVETRIECERQRDHVEALERQVAHFQALLASEEDLAQKKVNDEMQSLAAKNSVLTDLVVHLEDRLTEAEDALMKSRIQHAESEGERFELLKVVQDLRG